MTQWCHRCHGDGRKHRIHRVGCLRCLCAEQKRVLVPFEDWVLLRNTREEEIIKAKQSPWIRWWLKPTE
jgi:reverse gyrase